MTDATPITSTIMNECVRLTLLRPRLVNTFRGDFLFALFVKTAPWCWDNTILSSCLFTACPSCGASCSRMALAVRAARASSSSIRFLVFSWARGRDAGFVFRAHELEAFATVVRRADQDASRRFPPHHRSYNAQSRPRVIPASLTQGSITLRFDRSPVAHTRRPGLAGTRAACTRLPLLGRKKSAPTLNSQPWRGKAAVVATGFWGTIYDLDRAAPAAGQ